MHKTYRASVFASVYYGVLMFLAAIWFALFSHVPEGAGNWGTLFLVAVGTLGVPSIFAHVTIDDSGIRQRFFTQRSVAWADIISWQRLSYEGSDGPDIITIESRRGSFVLNANCVFGKRLAEVEAELRHRVKQTSPQTEKVA